MKYIFAGIVLLLAFFIGMQIVPFVKETNACYARAAKAIDDIEFTARASALRTPDREDVCSRKGMELIRLDECLASVSQKQPSRYLVDFGQRIAGVMRAGRGVVQIKSDHNLECQQYPRTLVE